MFIGGNESGGLTFAILAMYIRDTILYLSGSEFGWKTSPILHADNTSVN